MTWSMRALLFALILVTFSCKATHINPPNATRPNPGPTATSPNPGPTVPPPTVPPPNVKSPGNINTVSAVSCNHSDVQNALNHARDGFTVALPAGTCTWTNTLTITNAINLSGAVSGTTIIDDVNKSGCGDNPALFINIPANTPWRLTNLTIQGRAVDTQRCAEHIKIVTNSHAFRVDHITFNNLQSAGISVDGDAWGVLDHLTMNGKQRRGIVVHHDNWGQVGAWGDNSWAQPDNLGTAQAVYVEDSVFNITNADSVGSVACDAHGARVVIRHNTLPFIGTHGTDSSGRARSCRLMEVYNNTITDNGTAVGQAEQLRGGTELFFNNTITPTQRGSYGGILALEIYREANQFRPWGASSNGYKGACDGTSTFDKNDGKVYDSGTAGTASDTDWLSDLSKSWKPDQWVGYSLRNKSVPWGASIGSNTATTITTYKQSQGGSPHTFTRGDSYQILKAYPCLDQPGRGAGDYMSGGGSGLPPTPTGWPNQAIDPIYAWNNTKSGTLTTAIRAYYTHAQANRDYYDWTNTFDGTTGVGEGLLSARPATCTPLVAYWATDTNTLYQCATPNTWTRYYTPYTYPHPLTQGIAVH
jgi:hypothetical protein